MDDSLRFLSPKDYGLAIGVSESTVKRWVDDGRLRVMRTPGGHRRIPVGEAVRFLREHRYHLLRPELLGWEVATGTLSAADAVADPLADALERGDEAQVRSLLAGSYLAGVGMADLGDRAIRPALARIGELWHHDEGGIAVEHHAVQILIGALERLRGLLPVPDRDAATAVGGGPAGDPYLLGSILAGMSLAELGWKVVNLGPDTPRPAFQAALLRHRPRLLWVSVCAPPAASLAADLGALLPVARRLGTLAVVGGRCIQELAPDHGWQVVDSLAALTAAAAASSAA
ncbi:MAG: hypothetical protein RLZZ127_216 [Planctomycetota bacterium]|jgi:excisionase family DNA binding protein